LAGTALGHVDQLAGVVTVGREGTDTDGDSQGTGPVLSGQLGVLGGQ